MSCKDCGHSFSTPNGAVHAAHISTTTEVRSWTQLPVYSAPQLPDDFDIIGGSNKEFQAWRVPAKYILPAGSLNNTQHFVPGEDSFTVPENQIIPVRSHHNTSKGVIELQKAKASIGETATDIAITNHNGGVIVMKTGYYKFARPHAYEVGQTYYLSQEKPGEVISTRPASGVVQALFSVIDLNTISINVALY